MRILKIALDLDDSVYEYKVTSGTGCCILNLMPVDFVCGLRDYLEDAIPNPMIKEVMQEYEKIQNDFVALAKAHRSQTNKLHKTISALEDIANGPTQETISGAIARKVLEELE